MERRRPPVISVINSISRIESQPIACNYLRFVRTGKTEPKPWRSHSQRRRSFERRTIGRFFGCAEISNGMATSRIWKSRASKLFSMSSIEMNAAAFLPERVRLTLRSTRTHTGGLASTDARRLACFGRLAHIWPTRSPAWFVDANATSARIFCGWLRQFHFSSGNFRFHTPVCVQCAPRFVTIGGRLLFGLVVVGLVYAIARFPFK
jgi:hypothetical protein